MTEYPTLREKIAADKKQREKEHVRWEHLIFNAHKAGNKAAAEAIPTPMVVGTPKNLMGSLLGGDDGGLDPNKPQYYVSEGVCGFGWVQFNPQRGGESRRFINWITGKTKTKHAPLIEARKSYRGFDIWVSGYGQSYTRKVAYAEAFAAVVNEAGIEGLSCYGTGRLD